MKMVGSVWAISAETGVTTWKVEQPAGMLSLAVTAGGLVFGGDANGHFKAVDDRSGKVPWDMNLGSSVSGYPISFCLRGQAVRRRDHTGPSGGRQCRSARRPGPDAGQRAKCVRLRAAVVATHGSNDCGRLDPIRGFRGSRG
jgi:hypothetical protein